jgi:hypothetical protein
MKVRFSYIETVTPLPCGIPIAPNLKLIPCCRLRTLLLRAVSDISLA